jgi:hypothetical protein
VVDACWLLGRAQARCWGSPSDVARMNVVQRHDCFLYCWSLAALGVSIAAAHRLPPLRVLPVRSSPPVASAWGGVLAT